MCGVRGIAMSPDEKKSFWRFVLIYMSISFLLFISLALYYYFEQKHQIEDRLALEMNRYAGVFRETDRTDLPEGFSLRLAPKSRYTYPAFFRQNGHYIATSCAGFDYPGKAIVVEADPKVLDSRLSKLKEKIFLFMSGAFAVNLFISLFLSWLSLRPVREANRRFRIFVEDVVHDLNAPVSAIALNAETIAQECPGVRSERIKRSVETISNLYKNLEALLLERSACHSETVDLQALCRSIVAQIQPLFPQVAFEVKVPEDLRLSIDAVALERILYNLIVNAAKYTTQNARVTIGTEGGTLFIRDNGPGIADVEKMFMRRVRGEKTAGGFGLGLGIVRRLSDACGIDLQVASRPGEGTTLFFDLSAFITS